MSTKVNHDEDILECERCGDKYIPFRKGMSPGCSPKCRMQLREGIKECKICNEEYWPNHLRSVVCSNKCASQLAQTNEAKSKRDSTNEEKYGSKNVAKNEKVKAKTKLTNEHRHGGQGLASKSIKAKARKTLIERYGVEYVGQLNKKENNDE